MELAGGATVAGVAKAARYSERSLYRLLHGLYGRFGGRQPLRGRQGAAPPRDSGLRAPPARRQWFDRRKPPSTHMREVHTSHQAATTPPSTSHWLRDSGPAAVTSTAMAAAKLAG